MCYILTVFSFFHLIHVKYIIIITYILQLFFDTLWFILIGHKKKIINVPLKKETLNNGNLITICCCGLLLFLASASAWVIYFSRCCNVGKMRWNPWITIVFIFFYVNLSSSSRTLNHSFNNCSEFILKNVNSTCVCQVSQVTIYEIELKLEMLHLADMHILILYR